jgi:Leucine-rich repeat (LRR) protein
MEDHKDEKYDDDSVENNERGCNGNNERGCNGDNGFSGDEPAASSDKAFIRKKGRDGSSAAKWWNDDDDDDDDDDDGDGEDDDHEVFEGDTEAEVDASLQQALVRALQGPDERNVACRTDGRAPAVAGEGGEGGGGVVRQFRVEKRYDPLSGKWRARIERRDRASSSSSAVLSQPLRPPRPRKGKVVIVDDEGHADSSGANRQAPEAARPRRELILRKQDRKAQRSGAAASRDSDAETGCFGPGDSMEATTTKTTTTITTTTEPLENGWEDTAAPRSGAFRMGRRGPGDDDDSDFNSAEDNDAAGGVSPPTPPPLPSLPTSGLASQMSDSILLEADLVVEQESAFGFGSFNGGSSDGGMLVKAEPIRRKRQAAAVAALVMLTAIIVGVTTGVVLSRPDPPPTPGYPFVNVSSVQADFNASLSNATMNAIRRGSTPQAEAYRWLFSSNGHPDLPVSEAMTRLWHRFALATLFYATGGNDSWTLNSGWLDPTEHECLWYGIACPNGTADALGSCTSAFGIPSASCRARIDSTTTAMIEGLELAGNGLKRLLPREIGLLGTSGMTRIKLEGNNLEGTVPPDIKELATLQIISLVRNNLAGSFPTAICALTHLQSLFLNQNDFAGTIPASVANLVALKDLDLSQNGFTGVIPTQIGLMTSLVSLVASGNALTGRVPAEAARLTRLEKLDLSDNDLDISLPDGLGKALRSLKVLTLSENSGSGSLATQIGDFGSLTRLELVSNAMMGTIPSELGRLENLEHLLLRNNAFSGTIPTELGNLRNLIVWNMGENYGVVGPLPSELARLTALEQLVLASCSLINGSIPSEFGNLMALRVWDVSYNKLSGTLPSELGRLSALEEFTAWGKYTRYRTGVFNRGWSPNTLADALHARK